MFGNLLTLPIGEDGLLYVQPLYVEGRAENSFPLLRKVLVNYGDRVGYADTLAEALDQVFGAGAGEVANDSDEDPGTDGGDLDPDVAQLADVAVQSDDDVPAAGQRRHARRRSRRRGGGDQRRPRRPGRRAAVR